MSSATKNLFFTIETEYDSDDAEKAELAHNLRQQLLQTDVYDVRLASAGSLPPGAKAVEGIDWNTLLVTLAGSGGALVGLVRVLGGWLQRHRHASVTAKLPNGAELLISGKDVSAANVEKLIALMSQSMVASTGEQAGEPEESDATEEPGSATSEGPAPTTR